MDLIGKDHLLRDFIVEYQRSFEDPATGPDPSVDALVDIEDGLTAALLPLHLPELNQAARDDLKGKRTTDLPDLLLETADGLRACPQIASKLQTASDLLENMVLLDRGLTPS